VAGNLVLPQNRVIRIFGEPFGRREVRQPLGTAFLNGNMTLTLTVMVIAVIGPTPKVSTTSWLTASALWCSSHRRSGTAILPFKSATCWRRSSRLLKFVAVFA